MKISITANLVKPFNDVDTHLTGPLIRLIILILRMELLFLRKTILLIICRYLLSYALFILLLFHLLLVFLKCLSELMLILIILDGTDFPFFHLFRKAKVEIFMYIDKCALTFPKSDMMDLHGVNPILSIV